MVRLLYGLTGLLPRKPFTKMESHKSKPFLTLSLLLNFCLLTGFGLAGTPSTSTNPFVPARVVDEVRKSLAELHGTELSDRIARGTARVAALWLESDGNVEEFKDFCITNFMSDEIRAENLSVIMDNLKVLHGYSSIIRSSLTEYSRFTDRQELKADPFFRNSIPGIDPWKSKLAFFLQLNFPYVDQKEKLERGSTWGRSIWAEVRLGDYYSSRRPEGFHVPYQEEAEAFLRHIGSYFLRMGHLLPAGAPSPFPEGFLLNCHHGLRDNIKEDYSRDRGYERQALSGQVIERILLGEVPIEFLEDESTYWDPDNQKLFRKKNGVLNPISFSMEGLKRYEGFSWSVRNRQAEDALYHNGSTALMRTFDNSQVSLSQVETMIREFLGSPEFVIIGKLIRNRLDRDLEPFDIWYSGFQAQSKFPADRLDSIVRTRYPNSKALQDDLPTIYRNLGFSAEAADWLGNSIEVRPVVSGGYSNRPPMPGYRARFTTSFPENGLDYKGFRIAMHELGHVTEMLYSSSMIDYPVLEGVPTAGITEGVAEYFAYRNIQALGLDEGTPEEIRHLQALAAFWYNVDMGGQALTEIEIWKWMTEHPDATPEQVKDALLSISRSIWNTYFSPVFLVEDQHILSIYNHMITGSFYLYNYFIGNVVMYQLFEGFSRTSAEQGLAHACAEGNTLPDLWMDRAVGETMSVKPLLRAAGEAASFFMNREKKVLPF